MVTETVRGGGATATGGRKANEDALLAAAPVFVVADGMGGHLAGADSSRAVVDAFHALAGAEAVSVEDVTVAVERAREGVAAVMAAHGGQSGSTLTGAVQVEIDGAPWWLVVNVGDSRVYSYRAGRLAQVTVDHSRVQELVDAGQLTPEEAERHPERNIITRAIGDGLPGQDLWLVPMSQERRLVVVSDGLTKALSDAQVEALLAQPAAPADAARVLVETAVAAGARDNVTVVIAESGGAETPADAPTGGVRVWSEPADLERPRGDDAGDDDGDDVTQISARRAAAVEPGFELESDDDVTQISARRASAAGAEPEPDAEPDADDDVTQISSRRAEAAEVTTAPALPDDTTRVSIRRTAVTPAPGEPDAAVATDEPSATPAERARERFGSERRHAVPTREAPPIVEPSMPAPLAPASEHEVVEPDERHRREQRERMRRRVGLVGASIGVGLLTVSAAATGIWLLATL